MPENNQPKQYSSVELHFGSRGFYWWDIKLIFDQEKFKNEEVAVKLKDLDNKLRNQFVNYAKPGVGRSFSFDPLKKDE